MLVLKLPFGLGIVAGAIMLSIGLSRPATEA